MPLRHIPTLDGGFRMVDDSELPPNHAQILDRVDNLVAAVQTQLDVPGASRDAAWNRQSIVVCLRLCRALARLVVGKYVSDTE